MIALVLALVTVAQTTSASAADAAYARHDYVQAEALYRTAVSANPKDYRAWYRLAVIGVAQGLEKALSRRRDFIRRPGDLGIDLPLYVGAQRAA